MTTDLRMAAKRLQAAITKAHEEGLYAIACDEEVCHHERIKPGRLEATTWHSRLYLKYFFGQLLKPLTAHP